MVNTDRNRRGTEPYARWCERTAGVIPPLTRLPGTGTFLEVQVLPWAEHNKQSEAEIFNGN